MIDYIYAEDKSYNPSVTGDEELQKDIAAAMERYHSRLTEALESLEV